MKKRAGLLLTCLIMAAPVFAAGPGPKIVVSPDYLVSRDGDIPHAEMHIATNPLNHRNLVGASIVGAPT